MAKIAILGSNGFVGASLVSNLSAIHDVTPYNRNNLNLLDINEVTKELNRRLFDVVINAATTMSNNDTLFDTRNNLTIFMNFFNRSNYFGKFINLGSGAEYDRTMNIENIDESEIFSRLPEDSYGYGQNLKTRLCYEKENFFGLKIFNCFGVGEKETRIFPKLLRNKTFKLEDRYFDFFSIGDLVEVIYSHIKSNIEEKDINCVYVEKYKISEVVSKFCGIHNLDIDINIVKESEYNYTGSGHKLKTLNLELAGLDFSLRKYV